MSATAPSEGTELDVGRSVRVALHFRVEILNLTIGVFARCSGLQVEYEVTEYAEGGENGYVHKLRGRRRYPNLLLSRGVTSETGLLDWMLESEDPKRRPTATVELLDELGRVQRAWCFSGAFPVRWVGPTLGERTGEVASESLEIAHAGLLRG
jgi:phage tail-like protein